MSRRRVRAAVLGALGVVALAVAVDYPQIFSKDPKEGEHVAIIVTGVLTSLLCLTPAMIGLWNWARKEGVEDDPDVRGAKSRLARATLSFWTTQASDLGVTVPATINVRWTQPTDVPVAARRDLQFARSGNRYEGLLDAGALDQLHELYENLPRRRLAIVGGPGTGKTAALILLLLRSLRAFRLETEDPHLDEPIPVLIPLTGWDPQEDLLQWVAHVLRRDNPFLRSRKYGADAAGALVKERHIAFFFDGLDEMPARSRIPALQAISRLADYRIVVTSRVAEYSAAAEGGHFQGAAVVELMPVDTGLAADYLSAGHPTRDTEWWDQLAIAMMDDEESAAARALDRPLWLSLLRATYPDGSDPRELLDPSVYPSVASVRARLMSRVIPTLIPADSVAHAQRLLSWVAYETRKRETRDIDWWRVRRWHWPLLGPIVAAFFAALTGSLSTAIVKSEAAGIAVGIAMLLVGSVSGCAVYAYGLRRYASVPLRGNIPRFIACFALGCLLLGPGLLFVYADSKSESLIPGFIFGAIIGLAGGIGGSLIPLRDTPIRAMAKQRPRVREFGVALVTGLASFFSIAAMTNMGDALIVGPVVAAAALALISLIRAPDEPADETSPEVSWRDDRRGGLIAAAIGAVVGGVLTWLLLRPVTHDHRAVYAALSLSGAVSLYIVSIVCQSAALAECGLFLRTRLGASYRIMHYFALAAQHQVFRQVGAVYQFRHGELHDFLADNYVEGLEDNTMKTGSATSATGASDTLERANDKSG